MKKTINYLILLILIFFIFELLFGYAIYQYKNQGRQSAIFKGESYDENYSSFLHRYSSISKIVVYASRFIFKLNFPYIEALDNSNGVYPVNIKNKIIKSKYIKGDNTFISRNPNNGGYKFHPLFDFTNTHGNFNWDNDYFGFRNDFDYNDEINKNEFRILMTGGSECAGYSHNQPITFLLEKKLREHYSSNNIRVLNFCMNSYTLPYEIQTFIHLGWTLKPNLVISHTGFNDAYYFQLVPDLFAKKGLNYSFFQENWMNILYSLETSKFDELYFSRNNNQKKFVNSTFKMLDKYKKLVNASGSAFLVGIQPWNVDNEVRKNILSEYQKKFYSAGDDVISEFLDNNPNGDIEWINNIYKSIEELRRQIDDLDMNIINFANNNAIYPFTDIVHTTQEGAKMLADEYFLYLKENYNDLITNKIN